MKEEAYDGGVGTNLFQKVWVANGLGDLHIFNVSPDADFKNIYNQNQLESVTGQRFVNCELGILGGKIIHHEDIVYKYEEEDNEGDDEDDEDYVNEDNDKDDENNVNEDEDDDDEEDKEDENEEEKSNLGAAKSTNLRRPIMILDEVEDVCPIIRSLDGTELFNSNTDI